jgi:hypothetical protein
MRRCLFLLACAVLALPVMQAARADGETAATAPTNPPSKSAFELRVARLINALGADTLKARTEAERELLDIGPAALDHIPSPETLPTASIREGVRRIRIELERRKAVESLEPSVVTLSGKRPLSEVLTQIRRQTGNRFEVKASPEELTAPIEVDFDRTPFWKAVDEVAAQAGLRYATETSELSLEKRRSKATEADEEVIDYPGAFRLATTKGTLRPLIGSDDKRLLRVSVRIAAEPRLRPLFLHYAARNIRIRSVEGREYPPFTSAAKYELPLAEGSWLDLTFDVVVPANALPETVHLEGTIGSYTAAGTEEFVFSDLLAKGVSRRKAGVTVRLQQVKFEPQGDGTKSAQVEMSVVYDVGGPAFESHRTWLYFNGTWLSGKGGTRIAKDPGLNATNQMDGGIVVEYGFSGLKDDPSTYRFHYAAPTLLIDQPLRFTLRHVPVERPKLPMKVD